MSHIELGKIKTATFGFGGYQDAQIVFRFDVGGSGWGTTFTFECCWASPSVKELAKATSYKWTHEDRIKSLGEKAWKVVELLKEAKVNSLHELVGKPVRVYFENENGRNVDFEILKEVL